MGMMNAPIRIPDVLVQRHRAGHCLSRSASIPMRVGVLRTSLTRAVHLRGLPGLRAPTHARSFVVYAAEYLVQEGHVLEWRPILSSIGVPLEETGRYSELYDPIVDALAAFGRSVVVRHGARRFPSHAPA